MAIFMSGRSRCIGDGNFQIIYGISSYLIGRFCLSVLKAVLIFFVVRGYV